MGEVKFQSHNIGLTSYWLTSLLVLCQLALPFAHMGHNYNIAQLQVQKSPWNCKWCKSIQWFQRYAFLKVGPNLWQFLAAWQALMWHICGNCNETTICTEKHEIQNVVCKTVAILCQPQWLNWKIVIREDRKTVWTKQCHNHCTLTNAGRWCRISTRCTGTRWRSYLSVFPVRRWRCCIQKNPVRRKQLTFETVVQFAIAIIATHKYWWLNAK